MEGYFAFASWPLSRRDRLYDNGSDTGGPLGHQSKSDEATRGFIVECSRGIAAVTEVVVNHFGPDPAYVGGMGSVLRILHEHQIGGDRVALYPTWRPDSRPASALLAAHALARIVFMRRGQIAHVHLSERGSFIREGAILVAARIRGVGVVATIHGASFLPFATRHPSLAFGVLRCAHLITCLDRAVVERIERTLPSARCELLPNPVQIDDDSPSADKTEEVVLFAGEICRRKGADVLLAAWRKVVDGRSEARCILVGPQSDVAVPDIERLEVRGPLGPFAMKGLMRSARVVVLPSRAEGMPMVLTEAMSARRPFVSTAVGGIPELAQAGGVLVSVDDATDLAARLSEFLASPQLAGTIGQEGQDFCEATRSVAVIDARLRRLYTRVIRRVTQS